MGEKIELREFQKRFIAGATAAGIDTAALSLPRGSGKSWLAGHLLARILNPADPLFRPGTESVLCAASIEQARIVFRFVRENLEEDGGGEYRFIDSFAKIAATHRPSGTRLRVIGSNGRGAFGLVGCPYAVGDEPGAWETNRGTLLHDAIETAKAKPGSPLRSIYIGTLAPSTSGWWHDLVAKGNGFHGSLYVQSLQGAPKKWDKPAEIRRCNPLTEVSNSFLAKLLEERDEARSDSRLKARFLSYRLNTPTSDESVVLLTVDDFNRVCARPLEPRDGPPTVGIDLGAGRSWSSAVAIFPSGRLEAIAYAPGIPNLDEQEKRDRVPAGTYQKLFDIGVLRVSEGLRVQPPALLWDSAVEAFGMPSMVIADRARYAELMDCVGASGVPLIQRTTRWFQASEDVRSLRKLCLDGPLSCEPSAAALIGASLAASAVRNDDAGNTRLVKKGVNNCGRDDVAAAMLLAVGQHVRMLESPPVEFEFENLSVSA